jgi:hypothetical protein
VDDRRADELREPPQLGALPFEEFGIPLDLGVKLLPLAG